MKLNVDNGGSQRLVSSSSREPERAVRWHFRRSELWACAVQTGSLHGYRSEHEVDLDNLFVFLSTLHFSIAQDHAMMALFTPEQLEWLSKSFSSKPPASSSKSTSTESSTSQSVVSGTPSSDSGASPSDSGKLC